MGNNVVPGFNRINEWQGPKAFDMLDRQLRENIGRHHGKIKSTNPAMVAIGLSLWAAAGLSRSNMMEGPNYGLSEMPFLKLSIVVPADHREEFF